MGYVYADPAALEALGRCDGRAATAEGIEHSFTFVAARLDNAVKQGFWLLRGIAHALSGLGGIGGMSLHTSGNACPSS